MHAWCRFCQQPFILITGGEVVRQILDEHHLRGDECHLRGKLLPCLIGKGTNRDGNFPADSSEVQMVIPLRVLKGNNRGRGAGKLLQWRTRWMASPTRLLCSPRLQSGGHSNVRLPCR